MSSVYAARVPLSLWLLSLPLACSSGATPNEGASSTSSAAAPSASAAAEPAPPEGYDPAIAEALETLAKCTQPRDVDVLDADGTIDVEQLAAGLCVHDLAWDKLHDRLKAEQDFLRTTDQRLGRTCGTKLAHASPWVRSAAHRCIAKHPDGVVDHRATLERTVAALGEEKDRDVRRAMWEVVRSLDATKHGLAGRAVELARKESSDASMLEAAIEALLPSSEYLPTAPEVLAYAKELAREGRVGDDVTKLVLHAAILPAEACTIFEAMLGAEGPAWHAGLEGMDGVHGDCKASSAKATDAIVARIELAQSKPEAWSRDANYALKWGLDVFAEGDKPRLRAALAKLSPEQRKGYGGDEIESVLEKLR